MINFYNQADNLLYKQPNSQFITQDRFRGNVAPNPEEIEEEKITETLGIPATKVYQNSGGNGDGGTFNSSFSNQPYTAQSPENYVTSRTNFGNTGYLPGAEPEETFRDKIGGYIKAGIGAVVPGGNFLMNMAGKLDNFKNLSGTDKAFIEMQMANQEQNIHGMGNLPNQDRYGYNKRSAFGNYADLVSKNAQKAKDWQTKNPGKPLPDIHSYYLEKEKEQEGIKGQIDFNDFVRQKTIANKLRNQQETFDEIYSGTNIHGGDGITTDTTTTTGDGGDGFGGYANVEAYDTANKATYDRISDMHSGGGGGNIGGANEGKPGANKSKQGHSPHFAKGGRVGYFFGGLAARGMKR